MIARQRDHALAVGLERGAQGIPVVAAGSMNAAKAGRKVAITLSDTFVVARWRVVLHPNVDLRAGTVIQSFWSRLADEDRAPKVKLKSKD